MDAVITTDFAISLLGGAIVSAILIQYVKKAFKSYVKPKAEELVKFIELVVISGLVAMVWQQALEQTGTLDDQMTFGVRWLFYMSTSHLIYRWVVKKWMPWLGTLRTRGSSDEQQ